MTDAFFPPLTKLKPFYPGQWGILGSDSPLGLRTDTRGSVFYVDSGHARANDNNAGTDPDAPLVTITRANVRATTNANDFILVRQLTNALETWPVTITKNRVHLLSTFYRPGHGPELRPPGVTAGLLIAADNVEVAGFEIGGGDNTQDCIVFSKVAATWGADIHHNRFAFQGIGRDGINMDGAVDKPHFTIHDNWFNISLARTGIYIEQNSTRSEIYNNTFKMAAGLRGINLATLCNAIYAITDNYFCTDGATQGSAITCNINSTGCLFEGNHAAWLGANPAQNPYIDLGTNHWGENFAGDVVIYPV